MKGVKIVLDIGPMFIVTKLMSEDRRPPLREFSHNLKRGPIIVHAINIAKYDKHLLKRIFQIVLKGAFFSWKGIKL